VGRQSYLPQWKGENPYQPYREKPAVLSTPVGSRKPLQPQEEEATLSTTVGTSLLYQPQEEEAILSTPVWGEGSTINPWEKDSISIPVGKRGPYRPLWGGGNLINPKRGGGGFSIAKEYILKS
jgi:hypothetical protein